MVLFWRIPRLTSHQKSICHMGDVAQIRLIMTKMLLPHKFLDDAQIVSTRRLQSLHRCSITTKSEESDKATHLVRFGVGRAVCFAHPNAIIRHVLSSEAPGPAARGASQPPVRSQPRMGDVQSSRHAGRLPHWSWRCRPSCHAKIAQQIKSYVNKGPIAYSLSVLPM